MLAVVDVNECNPRSGTAAKRRKKMWPARNRYRREEPKTTNHSGLSAFSFAPLGLTLSLLLPQGEGTPKTAYFTLGCILSPLRG
jgi:hypothetical protein